MNQMQEFIQYLYVYCTDFVINLANLLNLSYYEVNFITFCLLYPFFGAGLVLFYLNQRRRLRNCFDLKKDTKKPKNIYIKQ